MIQNQRIIKLQGLNPKFLFSQKFKPKLTQIT